MKQSFFKRVDNKLYTTLYCLTHRKFVKKYSQRFSSNFNQEDLEYCVKHFYQLRIRKKINLNNVETFNEKLSWLKCFYHDDSMTECADKVTAPSYFLKKTGLSDSYIVKNIGIYDSSKEINFDSLPTSFVLKSNWGSGCQFIVKDKSKLDVEEIKKIVDSWTDIKRNHYFSGFEYGYKNIVPKIVCEEFVEFDYKIEFFCFNGSPKYFWVVFNDKTDDVCADFYDASSLVKIKMRSGYRNSKRTIEIPQDYKEMFDIATKLSEPFPFVRVDFFKTNTGFKFSELTFYHWSGTKAFKPRNMDYEFGKLLKLPEKKI